MSNIILNRMKFARKNNNVNKFVKTKGILNHSITCTVEGCGAIQDFDTPLHFAKESAYEAGWRKGIDDDNVEQCVCPECFEELEVSNKDNKHFTEMNSYGE